MESAGHKLHEARLRSGLSLEQISERTRISRKILAAIEADDTASIGSRFFYKSFVGQMARIVGVNEADLRPAFEAVYEALPEPLVPGQPGSPIPPDVGSLRPMPVKASRWAYSGGLLVVMLAVCSAVFGYWQNNREAGTEANSHPAVARTVVPRPEARPATVAKVAGEPVQLELDAREPSWVAVSSDGKRVFEGILAANQTKDLQAENEAVVKTGNAGAIDAKLNGRDIGVLGAKGQVRTVLFSRKGYEIEEPVSAPLAFASR